MIYYYHFFSFLLLPLYLIIILYRTIIGKEDVKRVLERFGVTSFKNMEIKERKLIWIHAASLGESVAVLSLIDNINKTSMTVSFLVTSGTVSSAKMLKEKLPKNAVHQFIPIDNIIFVSKFLKNWRPHLGIFIESELWPCLISEGSKYCDLLLLNARISDKSFKKWRKINYFFQYIMKFFKEIIVQSNVDFEKFKQLGVSNIVNLGNIKFTNKKLAVNEQELLALSRHLEGRRVIVLASTHLEDEQILFNIIKPIRQKYPDCYFILIPRHPERVNEISKNCNQRNLYYAIKSEQNLPVLTDDLYIVNKFGELGLFFSIAYISFIGGSFKQGGHNILEPAYFNNCIIFGPNMSNSADISKQMLKNQAAIQIQNESELAFKLEYFMTDIGEEESMFYKARALKFVGKNQQILQDYLGVIEKYIVKGKVEV